MAMEQTFTLLPLQMDPKSKAISAPTLPNDAALASALSTLNTLHRTLISLPDSSTPPPPMPPNPKRSQQIAKMRDQANTTMKKASSNPSQAQEAIKLYTFALQIALMRPTFEASALFREEASLLYANRAQAYMAASMWPEGAADAACSVELKKQGNAKAWWRRGKCLVEMGRWAEAAKWCADGVREVAEQEDGGRDLRDLKKEVDGREKER